MTEILLTEIFLTGTLGLSLINQLIKILGAYCVGIVHNMLSCRYLEIGTILRTYGTQYATLEVLRGLFKYECK